MFWLFSFGLRVCFHFSAYFLGVDVCDEARRLEVFGVGAVSSACAVLAIEVWLLRR